MWSLSLAGSRVFAHHEFDGISGFYTALLLKLINPIRNGFHHFARRLRGRRTLGGRLLLTRPLILLDDLDSFLFWHFNQLLSFTEDLFRQLNDFS